MFISFKTSIQYILQSNFKTCFNFFTFDTFECNFIMLGVQKIDAHKKLILRFNTVYKKLISNCMNQIDSMI